MRALTRAAIPVLGGAALGASTRLLSAPPEARASAALVAALGVAVCVAAALPREDSLRARLLGGAALGATAFASSLACTAAAGLADLVGSAAVVAGAAMAAGGIASLLRSLGAAPARATFAGAAAVAAFAGAVFVADPFVEWNAGGPGSLERARAAIAVSPVASIAAEAGLDWQRSRWMYDGPATGSPGLSVIGQYYPSRATDPFAWACAAAAAGLLALALASRRGKGRLAAAGADASMAA